MSGALSGAMLALLAAFMTLMLKSLGYDGGKLISVVGIVLLLCGIASGVGRIIDMLPSELFVGEAVGVLEIALRMLGVGYVFGTVADICRELGEGGLANAALGLGRVEILLLAMPYISEIIGVAREMVKV